MRRRLLDSALMVVLWATGVTTGGVSQQTEPSPQFQTNRLRDVNGTNLDWVYDGDGLGLSRPDRPSPRADTLIRAQWYKAVRIPGGTLARRFDWRAAIDTLRGRGRDFTGRLQPITTGLPEFKRFSVQYGMRVLYILNINDDSSSVVDLLRRWRDLPPAGRTLELLELSNEDYAYDGGPAGAARYAARVKPLIRAVRRYDPKVRIGAQLANPLHTGWDEVVERELDTMVDFWTWHRYFPYTAYDSVGSYEAVVDSTAAFDRDLAERTHSTRHPLWLTEYNFMFYQERQYQNIVLQPRYYLLLANLYYSAIRYGMPAMFKCCLVNPQFQAFVDIDSASSGTMALSLGGQASAFINRWLAGQDSVAVAPPEDGFRYTLSVGKSSSGQLSFLVSNHSAVERNVGLPVPRGYAWVSSEAIFQQGSRFGHGSPMPKQADGTGVTLPAYSLTVVQFSRRNR